MKFRGVLFAAILTAILCFSGNLLAYSGGSGTSADPYLIATAADMNSIGANSSDWGKCFKLTADIDMAAYTGTQYKIIGNFSTAFTGTFDGSGYKISHLTYTTTTSTDFVGMFGMTSGAIIKNLGIEDANINADGVYGVGSLIGEQISGTVTNCHSTGSVISTSSESSYAGGLIGMQCYGAVTNCYSSGKATSYSSSLGYSYAGGLIGEQYCSTATNCYSTGTAASYSSSGSFSSYSYAGGLIGRQWGNSTATNCYSTGAVTSTTTCACESSCSYAGGLIGEQEVCTITSCYSTGSVFSSSVYDSYAGGLIGKQYNSMATNCYSTGAVTSNASDYSYAGGLIGVQQSSTIASCRNTGSVTSYSYFGKPNAGGLIGNQWSGTAANCYSTGNIKASLSSYSYVYAGGLIGKQENQSSAKIQNCYSTGTVSASGPYTSYAGGLLGHYGGSGTIAACFWDIQTSGTSDGVGNADPDPAGAMGRTTADMMTLSTFTSAGWDFINTWQMPAIAGYPILSWQIGLIVPNVVGMTQANAESAITSAWLVVGTVTTAYSGSVAAGNVISQSPTAGTTVDLNTAVNFVVSLGSSPEPVNLNGQYWFGSLSASPWSKQGTVSVNGNNWVQEWDDQNGHHTFLSTFTTSVQPDGSINVNLSSGPYNIAWNGDVMIHAGSVLGGSGQGIDIFIRKANDIDVNDIVGEYCNFGHSLDYIGDWDISWDEDAWGTFVLDVNGMIYGTSTDSKGVTSSGSVAWDFNSTDKTINIHSPDSVNFAMPCKDGLILAATAGPDGGGGMGYQLFVRKVNDTITSADMAGTYQIRFLETGPGLPTGDAYTCSKGTCIIDANGTMHVDAWYSDGTHDVFDSTYIIGPGNTFSIGGNPEQGIISPDKNLILMPEYICSNPRNSDDWIGGIFLIRNTTPASEPNDIADLNGDGVVDFIDLKKFCEHWLETGCVPPYGCQGTDLDNDTKVDFKDYAIFAQHWLGGDKISNHIFEIDFDGEWLYESPGVINDQDGIHIEIDTDDTVNRIEFTTPAGNIFEIPNAPITEYAIAGGWMQIGKEFDYESGQYLWTYAPGFIDPNSLSAYGDGLYTFTVYYADGRHQHTTAWFGIPGTNNPIPQPTQLPVITSFNHGDTVKSPVSFTWQPCTDAAAQIIGLEVWDVHNVYDVEWNLPLSATGLDEPIALPAESYIAELDFNVDYNSINEDGIAIYVDKYSQSYYSFTVEPAPIPGDFDSDGDVDFADLMILANQWLQPPGNPSADIAPQPNGDGIVNFLDFAVFAQHWLEDAE